MGIAAAHFYLLIVGENGREASTPFWARFAIEADAPAAGFAIQADAPAAHVVWFASFGRSL
jgi:hypothetical protein